MLYIECDSRAKYFNPANIYKSYQCKLSVKSGIGSKKIALFYLAS